MNIGFQNLRWLALCMALLLSACGSGGGGGGEGAPAPSGSACVWGSSSWDNCNWS